MIFQRLRQRFGGAAKRKGTALRLHRIANAKDADSLLKLVSDTHPDPPFMRAAVDAAIGLGCLDRLVDHLTAEWQKTPSDPALADAALRALVRAGRRRTATRLLAASAFLGDKGWQVRLAALHPLPMDAAPAPKADA